jgi:hypothetical protein
MTVKTLQGRLSAVKDSAKVFCFIGEKLVEVNGAFTYNNDIIIDLNIKDEELYEAARKNLVSKQESNIINP